MCGEFKCAHLGDISDDELEYDCAISN
jgi:hypothetical protein